MLKLNVETDMVMWLVYRSLCLLVPLWCGMSTQILWIYIKKLGALLPHYHEHSERKIKRPFLELYLLGHKWDSVEGKLNKDLRIVLCFAPGGHNQAFNPFDNLLGEKCPYLPAMWRNHQK